MSSDLSRRLLYYRTRRIISRKYTTRGRVDVNRAIPLTSLSRWHVFIRCTQRSESARRKRSFSRTFSYCVARRLSGAVSGANAKVEVKSTPLILFQSIDFSSSITVDSVAPVWYKLRAVRTFSTSWINIRRGFTERGNGAEIFTSSSIRDIEPTKKPSSKMVAIVLRGVTC